jgi:hypothetical protein
MQTPHSPKKEKVLKLHKEFPEFTYARLSRLTGASPTTVRRYLDPNSQKSNTIGQRKRRLRKKEILVKEAGGKCSKCGYNKCLKALSFHHKDPAEKDFTLSDEGDRNLDILREEIKKCILLCANCHIEEHTRLENNLPC